MFKLSCPRPVLRGTRPVIWPCLVSIRAQTDHWLDREAHSWFRYSHRLVLGVMRHIRRTMKQLIDAVATVGLDHTATARFRVLLDDRSWIPEEHARFHELNGLVQALAGGLNNPHRRWISECFGANIVCFV